MAKDIGATSRPGLRTGAEEGNGADVLGRAVEDPRGPLPDPVPGRPAQDRVLRALRHRLPILLACAIITPVAAFLISNAQTEQYTATSTLLFRDLNLDQKLFGTSSFTPSTDPQRQADTDVKLASQREVAQRAAAVLHLPVDTVANAVSVAPNGQSDLVDINVTDPSPAQAARIANAFADEYIVYSRDADRQQVVGAQTLVQHELDALPATDRAGVAGAQLRKQVQQLNLLAAVQTGNAVVAHHAQVPTSPSSPHPKRNAVLGLIVGIALGLALVFLAEQFGRRIRDREEVESIFRLPVLAEVPRSRGIDVRPARGGPGRHKELEIFGLLRASLRYFNVGRRIHTVLITSPGPQDGKTTVALNLAASGVQAGERVLLIEADLRRPQLARRLKGLEGASGLSSLLAGISTLSEAMVSVQIDAEPSDRAEVELDVLPAGPLPPNPTQLLESVRMQGVLRWAASAYDLVVVDTAPSSIVSDVLPLASQVDGVIVVCRLRQTSRQDAATLRRQLDHLDAAPLGVVLNGVQDTATPYYATERV
jgi:capsular exopolysaccharide synthesis family protein